MACERRVAPLFDEAESLFGKRICVHACRDWYANLEVSYFRQHLKKFRSLAILATNRGVLTDAGLPS